MGLILAGLNVPSGRNEEEIKRKTIHDVMCSDYVRYRCLLHELRILLLAQQLVALAVEVLNVLRILLLDDYSATIFHQMSL